MKIEVLADADAVAKQAAALIAVDHFLDPLVDYRAKRITREAAVARIATAYRTWVDLFEKAK